MLSPVLVSIRSWRTYLFGEPDEKICGTWSDYFFLMLMLQRPHSGPFIFLFFVIWKIFWFCSESELIQKLLFWFCSDYEIFKESWYWVFESDGLRKSKLFWIISDSVLKTKFRAENQKTGCVNGIVEVQNPWISVYIIRLHLKIACRIL